ncbi:MAG TPA: ABC transporter permease [Gemmatimonadaceae bacterium]|nr:ABC transporter permease [Gemmatimonadaceae bacterium]
MGLLHDFAGDLRYAARTLRRAPGFTIAAVLTLAVGIGSTTTIFSAVDGVLLEPLPFQRPDRIVTVFQTDRKKGLDHDDVAPGNFADWRERSRAFAGLAAAEPFALNYSGPDGEEQIYNWNVTQDFFTVLNARPALGRLFRASDFVRGAASVVILTYGSWQRRFGADPTIVGRQLRIGGGPVTIVGVLPADFAYLAGSKMEIYAPKALDSATIRIRNYAWWHVVGRLKDGVTLGAARADMRRVAAQLTAEYPATNAEVGANVDGLADAIVGDTARVLMLLLGAVSMVLLIACTNVAHLLLARIVRRHREFALRSALGAARDRVLRHVLTESLLIACAGGLVGAIFAFGGIVGIRAASPASFPRIDQLRVDARALAFTAGVVMLATLLSGVVPALRAARPGLAGSLGAGTRSAGTVRQGRLRSTFVVTEVALAIVLLVGAGLLSRSFIAVLRADRGYRADHILAATVFVYEWNRTPAARRDFIARLVEQARTIPGVVAAGATSSLPLDMAIEGDKGTFTIPGRPTLVGEEPSAHMTSLTPGAFDALRLTLQRGRLFGVHDDSSAPPVAIISESMARQYWPDADAVGKHITLRFYGPTSEREIVGVVADVRQTALDAPAEPTIYLPHPQAPTGGVVLVVRTRVAPTAVVRSLKRVIAALNPALPIADLKTMDDLTATSLKPRRFALTWLLAFAGAALLLALIGVYGVINQSTIERWNEFGVRMALGAQARDIVSMVLRQGITSTTIGIAIGIAGGALLTKFLRSMLFAVQPFDPPTFAAVTALMLVTALLACLLPALRATAVEPSSALRQ